jgi:hypothetical protein
MACVFVLSISIAGRSHHSDPRLIQPRNIVAHEFKDFGRVRAVATRAFKIDLVAKLIGQRPSNSICDKAALDPEDDVPEEGYSARWTDIASYPLGGGGAGLEKTRERRAALPRIEVNRPGWNVSDHILRREIITFDLRELTRLTGEKRNERAQDYAGAPEPLSRDLNDGVRPTGFTQVVEHR